MRILDLARILRFFGYTMKYAPLMTKPTEWYFPLEEGQNKRKRCCRVFGNIRHSNNDHLQSYNRDNKLFYTKYCQFLQIMSQFFSAKYSIFAILKFHFIETNEKDACSKLQPCPDKFVILLFYTLSNIFY